MSSGEAMVPTFNKGLKGVGRQEAELAREVRSALCIDYLTFVADLECLIRNEANEFESALLRSCLDHGEHLELVGRWLHDFFFGQGVADITLVEDVRGFRHHYKNHFRLRAGEAECGWLAFGGERQRGTFAIQVTGAGCAHVKAWDSLQRKLESAGARITRVDIAFDDFLGMHTLDECRAMHAAGDFTTNGRPPVIGEQGWSDKSGHTVYVGKNAHNQQLCVYEKGKQLGDPESPWVRWEARFGSKYREIALDILTNPAAFYAGHYPALAGWLDTIGRRMATHVKRAQATLVKGMHWCKHQYGALLNTLNVLIPDRAEFVRVIESVSRPGTPRRLADIPHAAHARAAAVHLLSPAGAMS